MLLPDEVQKRILSPGSKLGDRLSAITFSYAGSHQAQGNVAEQENVAWKEIPGRFYTELPILCSLFPREWLIGDEIFQYVKFFTLSSISLPAPGCKTFVI